MTNQTSLAYVAGVFDRDGSIYITKEARKDKHFYYRPAIKVTMIHKACLDFCAETLGFGSVLIEKLMPNGKTFYHLTYRARPDVKLVLDKLLPFLIVKKPQALLIIKFLDLLVKHQGVLLMPDGIIEREDYYNQMQKLNFKSVVAKDE